MRVLIKKELFSLFKSPIAYIYILAFCAFSHWVVSKHLFLLQQATLNSFFNLAPYLFICIIPAITMRSWAEEKKQGTLDFLFTFPIKDTHLIISKFIATLVFLAFILLSTTPLIGLVTYLVPEYRNNCVFYSFFAYLSTVFIIFLYNFMFIGF